MLFPAALLARFGGVVLLLATMGIAQAAELIELPHAQLPLPGNGWRKLAEQDRADSKGIRSRYQLFARLDGKRVAGLVYFQASVDASPEGRGFEAFQTCTASGNLRRRNRAMTAGGEQDCSWIRPATQRQVENADLFRRAREALQRDGSDLPEEMLVVGFRFADPSTFLTAAFYFNPETQGLGSAAAGPWTSEGVNGEPRRKAYVDWLAEWMRGWYPAMQAGFAKRLDRAGLGRAEAALPAFTAPAATPPPRGTPAPGPGGGSRVSSGSGFIISTAGHVVTNHHVIDGCRSIRAARAGDRPADAALLASDEKLDVAVLRLGGSAPEIARFRNSAARLGESAIVMGFPLRSILTSDLQVTTGIVSGLAGLRNDRTQLQITAPVQPGNSGGPLFDERGSILGVIVAQIDAMRVARAIGSIPQNINFAIKEDAVRGFLDRNKIPWETEQAGATPASTADLAERGRRITVAIECRS